MWRFLGLLTIAGCLANEDPSSLADLGNEDPSSLADLGNVTLVMSRGPQFFDVTLVHDMSRCPVLGDDFAAYVGGIALSTAPGEWNDAGSVQVDMYNNSPQPVPAHCVMPWVGGFELPSIKYATLTIHDHSDQIQCSLGDYLQQRVALPVNGTWTMSRGERVELNWFPVADLARATFTVRFRLEGAIGYLATAPVSVDGDRLVFDVPRDGVVDGQVILELEAHTEEPVLTGVCGGVASTRSAYDTLWLPSEIR